MVFIPLFYVVISAAEVIYRRLR